MRELKRRPLSNYDFAEGAVLAQAFQCGRPSVRPEDLVHLGVALSVLYENSPKGLNLVVIPINDDFWAYLKEYPKTAIYYPRQPTPEEWDRLKWSSVALEYQGWTEEDILATPFELILRDIKRPKVVKLGSALLVLSFPAFLGGGVEFVATMASYSVLLAAICFVVLSSFITKWQSRQVTSRGWNVGSDLRGEQVLMSLVQWSSLLSVVGFLVAHWPACLSLEVSAWLVHLLTLISYGTTWLGSLFLASVASDLASYVLDRGVRANRTDVFTRAFMAQLDEIADD